MRDESAPMWTTALWDHAIMPLQWGMVIGVSLVAAILDLVRRRVPNLLTVPVWGAGLAWAFWSAGWQGLADALAGSVVMSAPYLVLFALASGGAGDAKLMAALGAWLGIVNGAATLACVASAGVLVAMLVATAQGQLREVLTGVAQTVQWFLLHLMADRRLSEASVALLPAARMRRMPYGPAVFVGVCVSALGMYLWKSN